MKRRLFPTSRSHRILAQLGHFLYVVIIYQRLFIGHRSTANVSSIDMSMRWVAGR